jgi:HEPN domain-containing protein
MKPLTSEWVEKAEQDYRAALKLGRERDSGLGEIVCFHCQQCAEKYLKARLQEAEIPFPKTHNLLALLQLVLPVEPLWLALRPGLKRLTGYAIELRYPGDHATSAEAQQAVAACQTVRKTVRQSLGLEGHQPELRVRERVVAYRTKKRKK